MTYDPFGQFVALVLEALIVAVVPALVVLIAKFAQAKLAELKLRLTANQWLMLSDMVVTVIRAAEQSGLAGLIENTAVAKKQYAIDALQAIVDAHSLHLPLAQLDAAIEEAVQQGSHLAQEPESEPGKEPAGFVH